MAMGFWTGMLIGWLGGNISMAFAYALVKRAQKASFNHVDWD